MERTEGDFINVGGNVSHELLRERLRCPSIINQPQVPGQKIHDDHPNASGDRYQFGP